MKKGLSLMMAFLFSLSLTPVVWGEISSPEGKITSPVLIAKAKKKSKKKKKKKKKKKINKKRQTNLPAALIVQSGNMHI